MVGAAAAGACSTSAIGFDPDARDSDGGLGGGGDDVASFDAAPADAAVPPCDASPWTIEEVDSWGGMKVVSHIHPVMRVSPSGAVELAYAIRPNQGAAFRFAHRAATGGWTIAETPGYVFGSLAGSVGPDGVEHFCYTEGWSSPDLTCIERPPGGAWSSGVVDQAIGLFDLSMLATPDGALHLVFPKYIDGTSRATPIYARRAPGAAEWTFEPMVGAAGLVPLQVDDAGCLHLARAQLVPPYWSLQHGRRCGDGALVVDEVELIAGGGPLLTPGALALDDAGGVHLLYSVGIGAHEQLRYAHQPAGGTWTVTEFVDEPRDIALSSAAIAVGPDGVVHGSYQARTGDFSTQFVYLRITADGAVTRTSLGDSSYAGTTAIAVDPSGAVHVALDGDVKRLRYARSCLAP